MNSNSNSNSNSVNSIKDRNACTCRMRNASFDAQSCSSAGTGTGLDAGNRRRCTSAENARTITCIRTSSRTRARSRIHHASTATVHGENDNLVSRNSHPALKCQPSNTSRRHQDGSDHDPKSTNETSHDHAHDHDYNDVDVDDDPSIATCTCTADTNANASCTATDTDTDTTSNTANATNHTNDSAETNGTHADPDAYWHTTYDTSSTNTHLSSLLHEGKQLYDQGQYEKAYSVQVEALAVISPLRSTFRTTKRTTVPLPSHNQDQDHDDEGGDGDGNAKSQSFNPSFERLDAMIRFELANIQYAMARENILTLPDADPSIEHDSKCPTDSQNHNTSAPASVILSHLHDQVQNAKCRIAMVNHQYYIHELQAVEESSDSSDWNQIYNKLYILHNLGKLCDQDLHFYDDALKYYQHALSIEEAVLDAFKKSNAHRTNGNDVVGKSAGWSSSPRGDFDWDVREFTQRVRGTRKKIGSIYYTSGRFDLALLSSFS